jgi:hypothetical protein
VRRAYTAQAAPPSDFRRQICRNSITAWLVLVLVLVLDWRILDDDEDEESGKQNGPLFRAGCRV